MILPHKWSGVYVCVCVCVRYACPHLVSVLVPWIQDLVKRAQIYKGGADSYF